MKFFILLTLYFSSIIVVAQQVPSYVYAKPQQLNDNIPTGTIKEAGIDEARISAATDSIIKGVYPNIHSLLIIKGGKLVYENYFPGNDSYFGKGPIGYITHHIDSLHDVRSISKTVIGAAVMMAIDQGKIKDVNQRVFDFFPEYSKNDTGTKRLITIKHLLTMSSGLEWDEMKSYADTTNSERKMTEGKDPVEYFLSQKSMHLPGKVFNYSGGCTQTLAAIIEKVTGSDCENYISEQLFQPLGINNYEWIRRADGIIRAASGLRLRSRDMAKLGLLYAGNGYWNGKKIISAEYVNESMKSHIKREEKHGYGFQLWLWNDTVMKIPVTTIQADGNGGQRIAINRQLELVVIITAGNYNKMERFKNSDDLYLDLIYPSVINNRNKKRSNKKGT